MSKQSMEAKVIQANDWQTSSIVSVGAGFAMAATRQSPTKTTGNEDALMLASLNSETAVLAVADGVGGQAAGAQASSLVLKTLQTQLQKNPDMEIREVLLAAIEEANQRLLQGGIGAATTLSLVLLQGNQLQSFHVGDSLILVVGQRGKVRFQTVSHSPVGYALEAGLLDEKEAMGHEDRHLVSNVLGSEEMRVEMGPKLQLKERDTVFLSSDGVHDNLHLEEIVARIRKGNLTKVVQSLNEEIQKRIQSPQEEHPSKPDDRTFILFRLNS